MRTRQLSRTLIAAGMLLGASLIAGAQQSPPQKPAKQKQETKATSAKSAKVWTADDLSTLRSPADSYVEEKQADADEAAAAAAAAKPATPAKPAQPHGAPPALSNPKTTDDADKMIAWENRDIVAQQQFIEDLKKQLDAAPADKQEMLQKSLQEHIDNLAVTQKERDGLVTQKQALEKKPAPADNAAGSQQPQ